LNATTTIRHATKKDLSDLVDLESICFKEETFSKKQLTYLLLKAFSIVLVASTDKILIGSIVVLLRRKIGNARIYSLNIHPEYRRKGIASMLMDSSEKLLREKGFKNITLEVGVHNKPAQSLYYSRGFVMDKLLKWYYKDGGDAYHLIKKL
jgi:ribosomal-protein-alanine N-acetyltransferase